MKKTSLLANLWDIRTVWPLRIQTLTFCISVLTQDPEQQWCAGVGESKAIVTLASYQPSDIVWQLYTARNSGKRLDVKRFVRYVFTRLSGPLVSLWPMLLFSKLNEMLFGTVFSRYTKPLLYQTSGLIKRCHLVTERFYLVTESLIYQTSGYTEWFSRAPMGSV